MSEHQAKQSPVEPTNLDGMVEAAADKQLRSQIEHAISAMIDVLPTYGLTVGVNATELALMGFNKDTLGAALFQAHKEQNRIFWKKNLVRAASSPNLGRGMWDNRHQLYNPLEKVNAIKEQVDMIKKEGTCRANVSP